MFKVTRSLPVRSRFREPRAEARGSDSGARAGGTERRHRTSRHRRFRLAMEQGAPAAIVLAAGLTAAGWIAFHRDDLVVEAARGWRVRRAPAHVENLQTRIGIGLAGGTVRPSDGGCISDGLRQ